ncbi:hypothetical protein c7_L124 [Megavirus courdo7]|uniref:Uncharacterized protein n=1 Tax=Megavirus courdo7 TaxID=1128135 RepID=H2E9W7_9VIRU|nr:hypothetical protein c7_L124 [Megavirus courdo7]
MEKEKRFHDNNNKDLDQKELLDLKLIVQIWIQLETKIIRIYY